jgi:hypothetical protein
MLPDCACLIAPPRSRSQRTRRSLATLCFVSAVLVTFAARSAEAQNLEVTLVPGLNLFSFPGTIPTDADSCFELLALLGGEGSVERVARIGPQSQLAEVCAPASGGPTGVDFEIRPGEAYLVHMAEQVTVGAAPGECPTLDLVPGVNLVGIATPAADLSCFDLLEVLGPSVVAAVERLDSRTGSFEDCSADLDGTTPDGRDFAIVPGEGYLVHLRSAVFESTGALCDSLPSEVAALAAEVASPPEARVRSRTPVPAPGAAPRRAAANSAERVRPAPETKAGRTTEVTPREVILRLDLSSEAAQLPGGPRLRVHLLQGGTLPPPIPEGLAPSFWIEVLPLGLPFSEPLELTLPNLDRLPPSSEVWIWSRHEPGERFEIAGEGRVSRDGGRIETTSGGIRGPGWHLVLPPPGTSRSRSAEDGGAGRP